MPYVNYAYYVTQYLGSMVDEGEFPSAEAQSERIIDAVTGYAVKQKGLNGFPALIQNLVRDAVCAQIDYIGYYGSEVTLSGERSSGFTVGKVSVHGGSEASAKADDSMMLCPMAKMLLEQAGLLYRGVPVAQDPFTMKV